MGATSDNYEIVTGGTTYTIASDYVNPFGGGTAHFQIVKAVYGTGDSVTNISSDTPLPYSRSERGRVTTICPQQDITVLL